MTRKELIQLGFKMKGTRIEGYWYELKFKEHSFITCDNLFNKGKDKWNIGYLNTKNKEYEDYFWFNNKLLIAGSFTAIFFVLTGKEFELPRRRKYLQK